ncbi:protein translocase subunit SecD [Nocardioides lentus]|uniref:Multifunctional fusion protein n=2 Tax=Nocardioides lentus TaxID=338077 RepID=A0ABN2PH10_9ACTN
MLASFEKIGLSMSRGVLVRLVLVLGLLAGCAAIALNVSPRLGLDLRGGSQIVVEVQPGEDGEEPTAEDTQQVVEVLRGRVDSLGVSEPTLVSQGTNQILVELPDVQNSDDAQEVLGQQAQLSVHPVVGAAASPDAEPTEEGNEVLASDQGDVIEIGPTAIRGTEIDGSDAVNDTTQGGGWVVNVDFDGPGGSTWQQITSEAACQDGVPTAQTDPTRRVAFVLDGEVISSPPMAPSVGCAGIGGGQTTITGDFDFEEANGLAVLIEGGSLPFPVEVVSNQTTGPTLGGEAIQQSALAAIIGLAATALFIGLVYRLVGLLATLALTSYALISYAILLALGATLTLPGLAGFVLAIGMAIDANVLVFERAREEYRDNPAAGMRRALSVGFNKAWSAIIDSNVTTLIAAGLLFWLAAGPVRGFGVTLSIGVVASMVSALVIARVLTELGVSVPFVRKRPAITGLSDVGRVRTWLMEKNFQIMARTRIWLSVSAALVVIALSGILVNGLNLGVEFTGGRTVEYATGQQIDADSAREVVADAGYTEAVVQSVTNNGNISVRAGSLDRDDVETIGAALGDAAGGSEIIQDSEVGASLGEQLRNQALIAFGLAFLGQLIYLAIRFKWTFGAAAIIAMMHDVLIVLGLFAWLGKPIDGVFLAAMMTIVGVSINDTVVVFDRIRERWRLSRPDATFADEANTACLETTPRTINTGIGIMFILAALAVLGGSSLGDFSIALLVGLVVGTFSSVFLATPLTIIFNRRAPLTRTQKVRKERDLQDSGAVV